MIDRVEPAIFDKFPGFCRGLVVARAIDNTGSDPRIAELLREEEAALRARGDSLAAHPRLAAWQEAYRQLGVDPRKFTPSIVFLAQRIGQGKSLPTISAIVDLFNWTSLKHLMPVGGDTVDALTGDLTLGLAEGTEVFSSLGKPQVVEHPEAGEVIYVNRQSNRVLCRRWNWRNADFSKITPETRTVVLNVDGMTPAIPREEIEEATETLARMILRYCQGVVSTHYLDRDRPEAEILGSAV